MKYTGIATIDGHRRAVGSLRMDGLAGVRGSVWRGSLKEHRSLLKTLQKQVIAVVEEAI